MSRSLQNYDHDHHLDGEYDDGDDQGVPSEEVGKEFVRVNFWKLQTGEGEISSTANR